MSGSFPYLFSRSLSFSVSRSETNLISVDGSTTRRFGSRKHNVSLRERRICMRFHSMLRISSFRLSSEINKKPGHEPISTQRPLLRAVFGGEDGLEVLVRCAGRPGPWRRCKASVLH